RIEISRRIDPLVVLAGPHRSAVGSQNILEGKWQLALCKNLHDGVRSTTQSEWILRSGGSHTYAKHCNDSLNAVSETEQLAFDVLRNSVFHRGGSVLVVDRA